MLAFWMVYVVAVSTLVGFAAWVLERRAAASGRTLRWIWALAFVATLGVVILPGPTLNVAVPGSPGGDGALGPIVLLEAPGAGAPRDRTMAKLSAQGWLIAGWFVSAVLLFSAWCAAALRTRKRRRSWLDVTLPEGRVLVSRRVGPAVVGILRNQVVVPRWCLRLPPVERGLVLEHELEHIRARDTIVLGAATLLTLLVPWNLPFWAYLRRLRAAVEVDCDARVVKRHPRERLMYGELLIAVASHARPPGLTLATFSQDTSTLGRRIQMLARNERGISRPQALLLTTGGLLLLAGACLVPGPDRGEIGLTGPEGATESVEAAADAQDPVARQPTFTPMEVRPELTNGSEVQRSLLAEYPDELRDAGIGGTANLHIFIDETGRVMNTGVARSSGFAGLDEAAARVAEEMRFSPALNREEPVPVWIEMPITFRTAERPEPSEIPDEPTFTPMEVRPELTNGSVVQRALQEAYPAELRDAGIGGTAILHIFIDEEGRVRSTGVSESSGSAMLDEAAAEVAATMEFSPALNRNEAVAVWIEMPITMRTR